LSKTVSIQNISKKYRNLDLDLLEVFLRSKEEYSAIPYSKIQLLRESNSLQLIKMK
jgi:hypothetical protein